jgi:hypothetical protein
LTDNAIVEILIPERIRFHNPQGYIISVDGVLQQARPISAVGLSDSRHLG